MKKSTEYTKEYRGVLETTDGEVRQFLLKINGDEVSLWVSDELMDMINNAADYKEWKYPGVYYNNLADYKAGKSIALQLTARAVAGGKE